MVLVVEVIACVAFIGISSYVTREACIVCFRLRDNTLEGAEERVLYRQLIDQTGEELGGTSSPLIPQLKRHHSSASPHSSSSSSCKYHADFNKSTDTKSGYTKNVPFSERDIAPFDDSGESVLYCQDKNFHYNRIRKKMFAD